MFGGKKSAIAMLCRLCVRLVIFILLLVAAFYLLPSYYEFYERWRKYAPWMLFAIPCACAVPVIAQLSLWLDQQPYSKIAKGALFLCVASALSLFSRILSFEHFIILCLALVFALCFRMRSNNAEESVPQVKGEVRENFWTGSIRQPQLFFIARLFAFSALWFGAWLLPIAAVTAKRCGRIDLCMAMDGLAMLFLYPVIMLFLFWLDRKLRKRGMEVWKSIVTTLAVEVLLLWQYQLLLFIVAIPFAYLTMGKVEFR